MEINKTLKDPRSNHQNENDGILNNRKLKFFIKQDKRDIADEKI